MTHLLLGLALGGDGAVVGYAFVEGTGAPLRDVVATVGEVTARSDAFGRFELTLPEGSWTLTLAHGTLRGGRADGLVVVEGEVTEVLATFFPEAPPRVDVQAPSIPDRRPVEPDAPLGRVDGEVTDAESAPLADARLFVRGLQVDAVTGPDGTFHLELPAGEHEITVLRNGFATATVPVVVDPSTPSTLLLRLREASSALEEITVTAPYVEGSVAGLLDERREATTVQDVLGAEQMSRAGDSDAARALSRVTGITVVDGKYVYVRGLGERYSSSLLNGALLPSPEPERRVVPLDLFPSTILESVVVQKSYSPDMPGEFGGGVVQLRTRRPPTAPVAQVSLTGAYRHGTTGRTGLDYAGGPTDWLGFDGGYRDLDPAIAAASAQSPLEEADRFSPERGYDPEALEAFGEAIEPRWNLSRRQLPPDWGASLTLGHGMENDDVSIGVLGALTYGNSWQRLQFDRTYYTVGAGQRLEPQHVYAFDQATQDINLGGFLTTGAEVHGQSVRYTGMITRSTDDTARLYEGFNRDVGGDIRVSRTRFVERQLVYHQLLGHHPVFELGEVDWRAVRAGAQRSEPDRRETRYDLDPVSNQWLLSDRPEGNGIFYSELGDTSTELGADLSVFLRLRDDGEPPGRLKVGAMRVRRDRGVDTRRYKYFHKGDLSRDPAILTQQPDQIFVPENIGPDGFQFEEFTRQTDNYTASQDIDALYGMAEVPVLRWLQTMAGLRWEHSDQRVTTFELFNPDAVPVPAALDTRDLLPAASLTLTPVDAVQLRLGYGRTVSRPDFRELSPATFNDVTGGRLTFGNENLRRATIDHFDLRVDWFLGPGELLSASLFRKRFTDPIETIVVVSAQQSVTWENATSATNDGVELEFRKDLVAGFSTAGNVALVRSQVDLSGSGGIQTSTERALQGQSPYVVNLQLAWDHPDRGDRFTLLYNVAGKRIVEVGAQGAPDTYELPVHRLDAVGRKDLGRGFAFNLAGSNLLNSPARTLQGTSPVDDIRSGWRVQGGISWAAP